MCRHTSWFVSATLLFSSAAILCATPYFAAKPQTSRDGDTTHISFAVSEPTDVEVTILNSNGRIVRRLAAGLLGDTPPLPFAPGLEQNIVWDGKDDAGRPAEGEPFNARVALGLDAEFDGTAFGSKARPDTLTKPLGLVCAPGGRLYVLSERWRRVWWRATSIHAFGRDGKYECTIKPFSESLPRERLAALTPLIDDDGRPVPVIYRVLAMSYYSREDLNQHMAVTPDGNLHFMVRRAGYHGKSRDHGNDRFLATLAPDGAPAYPEYTGPALESSMSWGDLHLASSSDGNAIFLSGYFRGPGKPGGKSSDRPNAPAIWRIGLPERKEAVLFHGDPDKPGPKGLSDPRGLTCDDKGTLYVADRGNNRIVMISEKDSRQLGVLPVKSPYWVGFHRKTEALYVAGPTAIVKFAADAEGRWIEADRKTLPVIKGKRSRWRLSYALDTEAMPAVLWVARSRGDPVLMRAEDDGNGIGKFVRADYAADNTYYWNLSAFPDDGLVSCKVGSRALRILNENTGTTRDYSRLAGSAGQTFRVGPNGQIYGMDHSKWGIRRWDANGKPLPFPETADHPEANIRGRLPSKPSGTTAWERDFFVDRAGNVYVKQHGLRSYHGRMRVDQYNNDGGFVRTLLWSVSDGALGPRLDAAGNIYIAESVKPVGQPFPDFFKGKLPSTRIDKKGDVEQQYRWMYGSILKFGPVGGLVRFPVLGASYALPFEGEPNKRYATSYPLPFSKDPGPPSGLTSRPVDTVSGDYTRVKTGEVQGAEWLHFGCSYVLDMQPSHNRRCHCTATEFEVDDYGRTYFTDQGRFRIVILDTAGNELMAFGSYGNQDACGPEIAFNWFGGLAVTDRWIYVADLYNRRVLRIRKTYAAEESVQIIPE